MTDNEALALIKTKIGGEDSDLRNTLATASLSAAIGSLNRLGEFEWNRKNVNFSLTSGTGSYTFQSLWPEHEVRGLESSIYLVGQTGVIEVLEAGQFYELTKYRSTTTGTPIWAAVNGKDKKIDFYPVPNSAYSCNATIYLMIADLDEVPIQYHDMIVDRAVMLAIDPEKNPTGWRVASNNWQDGIADLIKDRSFRKWTGNQISIDPWATYATTGTQRSKTDSGNLTGV